MLGNWRRHRSIPNTTTSKTLKIKEKSKFLAVLFLIAVAINYVWEVSQAFLYQEMVSLGVIWWHCFVAALGDGLILWLIHLCGWIVFQDFHWFAPIRLRCLGFMAATGLAIATAIEWIAVHQLNRWSYTDQMPMIPWLDIGLVPVLQMVLIPPTIFWLANRFGFSKLH